MRGDDMRKIGPNGIEPTEPDDAGAELAAMMLDASAAAITQADMNPADMAWAHLNTAVNVCLQFSREDDALETVQMLRDILEDMIESAPAALDHIRTVRANQERIQGKIKAAGGVHGAGHA